MRGTVRTERIVKRVVNGVLGHAMWRHSASSCFYDADASSEPGCSLDQKEPGPDDDGPDGSRDALTRRRETFDGDGCRHHSHRPKVHDPDDQEDRRQTGTAVAAVEAEAQAVPVSDGNVRPRPGASRQQAR